MRSVPPLYAEHELWFLVLNGFIVVSFCDKEGKADLNGFHGVRRRKLSFLGGSVGFRYMKSNYSHETFV